MVKYHRIELPKMTVFLSSAEILGLLNQNNNLFQKGLERGKAFKRVEGKKEQYAKKLGKQEADFLNKFI
jgi:hypothetical protein